MSQHYSDESRADEKYSLPDIWVTQLTAREAAEQDEDLIHAWMRKPEYRLASMNSRTREAMFDAMIEEEGIAGGYFWAYCMPGCMPDSSFYGPFATEEEAIADMRAQQDMYG